MSYLLAFSHILIPIQKDKCAWIGREMKVIYFTKLGIVKRIEKFNILLSTSNILNNVVVKAQFQYLY